VIVVGRHLHGQLSVAAQHRCQQWKEPLVTRDPMQRGIRENQIESFCPNVSMDAF
jgi:hypothetical protein